MTLILALSAPAAALEQKLIAADGAARDQLGRSVAIDGDTAVVGAPSANIGRGAVYVFARVGDSWTQTAKLIASDGALGDELGFSVAIAGDTIAAGAPSADVDANRGRGSVYTFARSGAATRTQTAKLTATDGAAGDLLGYSVAIAGGTIVAGAPSVNVGANQGQGSVYTFAGTGGAARTQIAKLTATDGAPDDFLGRAVAIAGDTIAAGAPQDDADASSDQGSVYTFAGPGGAARTQTAKLTGTDSDYGDQLGRSVAIAGDTIVAGAPYAHRSAAYTFTSSGAVARTETAKLTASDGAVSDQLGFSVAIAGSGIVEARRATDVASSAVPQAHFQCSITAAMTTPTVRRT